MTTRRIHKNLPHAAGWTGFSPVTYHGVSSAPNNSRHSIWPNIDTPWSVHILPRCSPAPLPAHPRANCRLQFYWVNYLSCWTNKTNGLVFALSIICDENVARLSTNRTTTMSLSRPSMSAHANPFLSDGRGSDSHVRWVLTKTSSKLRDNQQRKLCTRKLTFF